jgi:hypothetical protein
MKSDTNNIDDLFLEFAKDKLKDRFYNLVYTSKVNEDENVFIVGNCEGVDNIKNLSNGLFGAISDHLLKSKKQDQDIFVDINNLKNLLDKIIYYL